MMYPETGKYGHWVQNKNPIYTGETDNVGFEQSFSTWKEELKFIGLHRSVLPQQCYLEGSVELNPLGQLTYYYTVGMKAPWVDNILPGYLNSSRSFPFHEVCLWLKITNLNLLNRIRSDCTFKISQILQIRLVITFLFIPLVL